MPAVPSVSVTKMESKESTQISASALDVLQARLNLNAPRRQFTRVCFVGRIQDGYSMNEIGHWHDRIIQSVEPGTFSGITILQKTCVITYVTACINYLMFLNHLI